MYETVLTLNQKVHVALAIVKLRRKRYLNSTVIVCCVISTLTYFVVQLFNCPNLINLPSFFDKELKLKNYYHYYI